jgi:hypothetical protein
MNNGLCPACGCLMEQAETGYGRDDNGEATIVEIRYECPCREYQETTYED